MPRIRAASIDEHKALTRRALLAAAKDLIDEVGTAEISLGEVALAAGVGRTTFYDYFSDRDDVIASLVEEELPGVLNDVINSVPKNLGTADRLIELAIKTVEFVATDRVYGVILHQEVGRMGLEAQDRIKDSHEELSSEMAGLYMRGVREGIFAEMPPMLAGRLIQDTIMSAARVLIDTGSDPKNVESITAGLKGFLIGGLSPR
ncbi:MAG: TetR/AcrR family transcriptional regulator [Actinomycetota bacterium]|nr:TetR/AcrR family transcriptional regulator [Actinomycetota bacterium]